jgi:dephospho-CoA kinase
MTVIGIVGLPGSGKSEAAAVAREAGVPVVTMGDVIRQACRDRGLDPATHHGEVAQALREEGGPDAIARESLPAIEDHLADHDTVLVDGIRSDVEVERFVEAFGEEFLLVAVHVPFETRAGRLDLRSRDAGADEGGESLAERDEREKGFGMDDAIEMADLTVDNTGTLAAFRETVRALVEDGPGAVASRETVTTTDHTRGGEAANRGRTAEPTDADGRRDDP